jgi:protein TonB
MAKDINLYSQEWCDIVFEGKNQDYGAYQIRRTSSKRYIIAFIFVIILSTFVGALPTIITKVGEAVSKAIAGGITDEVKMTQLDDVDLEIPDDFVPPELPPPPIIASIKFTAPEITRSEDMTDDDAMKTQTELTTSTSVVSIIDHVGDADPNAVDARDLIVQKEVVQEAEVIHQVVEQMPEFPGGLQELNSLIKRRLQYPQLAAENQIQGTTVVQFAVMKDGSVDKVTVYVSAHPLLDKEAMRVVKTLPKWIPGKINGKGVNCYYIIPIVFTLQ